MIRAERQKDGSYVVECDGVTAIANNLTEAIEIMKNIQGENNDNDNTEIKTRSNAEKH